MNIGQIVDALGGWCYRSSVARELERRWYRSRLWRLVGESWNRKRVDRYRPHHLYETVISNDRMWFKLQASCWSSRQAAAFLESRFNGTRARIKGCVKREATYLSLRSQTSEPG